MSNVLSTHDDNQNKETLITTSFAKKQLLSSSENNMQCLKFTSSDADYDK